MKLVSITELTKVCTKCKQTKSTDEYYKHSANKNKLQSQCKQCISLTSLQTKRNAYSTIPRYLKQLLRNTKSQAKVNNRKVSITLDDLMELYCTQKGLCKLSGIQLTRNLPEDNTEYNISIDRIDSSKQYIKDNVQLVANIINRIKTNLPQSQFISLCHLISKNNINGTN